MILEPLLLSVFAKTFKFNPDVASVQKRSKILFLIVANFALLFIMAFYSVVMQLFFPQMASPLLLLLCCTFMVVSFLLLRRGHDHLAAGCTLCYLHTLFFVATLEFNICLGVYCSLYVVQLYTMLLGFSDRVITLNILACYMHFGYNFYRIQKVFRVTLDDEQSYQLYTLLASHFACFNGIALLCFQQSSSHASLWQFAQSNFQKSESLTREMIQVVEARDAFVFSLSHEMKNALVSIHASLEYLLRTVKSAAHLEALKNVGLNSEVLQNMINNILDASELKNNRLEVFNTSSSLTHIVEKALGVYVGLIKRKRISMHAYFDENLPKELWVDSSRLLQIIINLISNALKYTLPGGKISVYATWCPENTEKEILLRPAIVSTTRTSLNRSQDRSMSQHIRVNSYGLGQNPEGIEEFTRREAKAHTQNLESIRPFKIHKLAEVNSTSLEDKEWSFHQTHTLPLSGSLESLSQLPVPTGASQANTLSNRGYLKVQITDDGRGIDASNLATLFDLFNQEQSSRRLTSVGTSLGLWVCKQLCQKMNGDIQVFSRVNHGSSFVFYIPINNTHIIQTSRMNISSGPAPHRPQNKITALVVDDYAFNRDLHKLLLEKEDVQVTLASDGKEALETYIKNGGSNFFDFIMMDVQMPVMDGFQAAKQIRDWEREHDKSRVDVYFVSGEYFNEEDVMSGLQAKGDMRDTAGIKCLRKPVDIQMLRGLVGKHKKN